MRQLCIVTGGAHGIGEGIVRRLHDDVRTSFYSVVVAEGPVYLECHCSHWGTALEYGLISERGLRCRYHGWLYDVGTARSWACEVWVYRTADLRETSAVSYQPFENDAEIDRRF